MDWFMLSLSSGSWKGKLGGIRFLSCIRYADSKVTKEIVPRAFPCFEIEKPLRLFYFSVFNSNSSGFKALIILFDNDVVVDEGTARTGTFCLTGNGPSKYDRWPIQRSYVVI